MYRYICYASESADKKVFYDTISEIKKLYPDCTEDTSEIFDRTEMGQVLLIPDEQGNTAKICIKKEYETNKVFVMSETYISKYYEDKQVSNIFIHSGGSISKGTEIISSIPFVIINLIAAFAGYCLGKVKITFTDIIIALILSAVYIFSSFFIKNKLDISLPKILFIQSGGYLVLTIFPVVFIFALISDSWGGVFVILFEIIYLRIVIISLAASGIISSIIYKFSKSKWGNFSLKNKKE